MTLDDDHGVSHGEDALGLAVGAEAPLEPAELGGEVVSLPGEAAQAASHIVARSDGLPLRALPERRLPADS
jgi:hypothetical protein